MITSLEQLTMAQFIDLLCGDTSVITGKTTGVSSVTVSTVMRDIIFEYREITDMAGLSSYISELEDLVKAKMSVTVFSICKNLVSMEQFERIKDILSRYGVRCSSMSHVRLTAEVTSGYEKSKSTLAKIENEKKKDNEDATKIRKDFDTQTASLMAHFKFQIDVTTMKATVYANLVARCNREIKAQMEAMNRK